MTLAGVGLPSGWVLTTLGDAFIWGSGGTPTSSVTAYYGGNIPWAVIGDLTDGLVSKTQSSITKRGLADSSARWVEEGSVLIAMYGSIGKLGISGVRLATNQAIAFTNADPVNARYLFWYLRYSRGHLIAAGKGGTQQNISQTVIKAFPFLLAPLAEQRRIVEAIEEQLTRLDAAVAGVKRTRANLKRYRAAVLKAACEGRLVPTEAELARAEGRAYEPADRLLARILEERRARWEADQFAKMQAAGKAPKGDAQRARYAEPAQPNASELATVPTGWAWATVDQLSTIVQYGTSAKTTSDSSGVPVIRMGNIINGQLALRELKFLPPRHTEFPELHLRAGDVLFNRTNSADLVGKTAVYRGAPSPCSFASYLIRVRLCPGMSPDLLAYYIV